MTDDKTFTSSIPGKIVENVSFDIYIAMPAFLKIYFNCKNRMGSKSTFIRAQFFNAVVFIFTRKNIVHETWTTMLILRPLTDYPDIDKSLRFIGTYVVTIDSNTL